jgi:hypothetical protein
MCKICTINLEVIFSFTKVMQILRTRMKFGISTKQVVELPKYSLNTHEHNFHQTNLLVHNHVTFALWQDVQNVAGHFARDNSITHTEMITDKELES